MPTMCGGIDVPKKLRGKKLHGIGAGSGRCYVCHSVQVDGQHPRMACKRLRPKLKRK